MSGFRLQSWATIHGSQLCCAMNQDNKMMIWIFTAPYFEVSLRDGSNFLGHGINRCEIVTFYSQDIKRKGNCG